MKNNKEQQTISSKIEAGINNTRKHKWKKGQSGNPKGRKPKSFSGLADELQRAGHAQVTKEQLREAFQLILGLDKDTIFKLANDIQQPWAIHIIATRFLSREGYHMLEDMLDRAHGKPTQATELGGEVEFTLAGALLSLGRKKQRDEK